MPAGGYMYYSPSQHDAANGASVGSGGGGGAAGGAGLAATAQRQRVG